MTVMETVSTRCRPSARPPREPPPHGRCVLVNVGSWLDEYDRDARLVPALLAILPLVLAAIGLGLEGNPIVASVAAVLIGVGVPMVVAKQVGDRGRALEATLFAGWGAPPTTLILVPPMNEPTGEIQRQRRTRLERLSGVSLPLSPIPNASEIEKYQAAVRWLIEHTRDRAKFPVVWSELKSYGFERNALAIRIFGLLASGVATAALLAASVAGASGADLAVVSNGALGSVCAIVGLWWLRVPSANRVRMAADRYAERLLDASALLSSS